MTTLSVDPFVAPWPHAKIWSILGLVGAVLFSASFVWVDVGWLPHGIGGAFLGLAITPLILGPIHAETYSFRELKDAAGLHVNARTVVFVGVALVAAIGYAGFCDIVYLLSGGKFSSVLSESDAPAIHTTGDLLWATLGAGALEEPAFRQVAFGLVVIYLANIGVRRNLALTIGLLFSVVSFALSHAWKTPIGWVLVGGFGCVLCALYWCSGRAFLPPFAAHAVYNWIVI